MNSMHLDNGYEIRTERTGLTCRGAIFFDNEYVFGLQNMFTERGIQKELSYYVKKLEEGATVKDLERDLVASKAGW